MSSFITIENTNLATVTGGGGEYTNDYGDLSGLADGDSGERPKTPEGALDHFLYGGKNMTWEDRYALVRNWEETNGRPAPTPMHRFTPQPDD